MSKKMIEKPIKNQETTEGSEEEEDDDGQQPLDV